MSLPITPTDLQKPGVLRSQRREWVVERTGWVLMALLLAAGLLGLLGGGPLAHASLSSGTVELKFDRIVRHSVTTHLRLHAVPADAVDGRLRVSLDWDYLGSVNLLDLNPVPASVVSSTEKLTWEFVVDPKGTTIVWELEPTRAGSRQGRLEVGENTDLVFRQMVLP